jgi:uncharacterized protein
MAAHAAKVVVTGAFGAGKTQFIAAASEVAPVRTERRVTDAGRAIKPLTTAALDYGRLHMGDDAALHLYGTPGQRRFVFMWSALARGMRGFVLVVDSARPADLAEAAHILAYFRALPPVPFVVAANKQDLPGALTPDTIRAALSLEAGIAVLPCRATDTQSARSVLAALLELMPLTPVAAPGAVVRLPLRAGQGAYPPAPPIAPMPPARLATVALGAGRGKRHLARGGDATLCGRPLAGAVPVLVFGADDCRTCAARAARLGLCCERCGRPLTRSRVEGLCLGCAQGRATEARDRLALAALDGA